MVFFPSSSYSGCEIEPLGGIVGKMKTIPCVFNRKEEEHDYSKLSRRRRYSWKTRSLLWRNGHKPKASWLLEKLWVHNIGFLPFYRPIRNRWVLKITRTTTEEKEEGDFLKLWRSLVSCNDSLIFWRSVYDGPFGYFGGQNENYVHFYPTVDKKHVWVSIKQTYKKLRLNVYKLDTQFKVPRSNRACARFVVQFSVCCLTSRLSEIMWLGARNLKKTRLHVHKKIWYGFLGNQMSVSIWFLSHPLAVSSSCQSKLSFLGIHVHNTISITSKNQFAITVTKVWRNIFLQQTDFTEVPRIHVCASICITSRYIRTCYIMHILNNRPLHTATTYRFYWISAYTHACYIEQIPDHFSVIKCGLQHA